MTKVILSALFFLSAGFVSAHAAQQNPPTQTQQELDLAKINKVLNDLGASLIAGDDLFTELTAEFTPEETSLKEFKAQLSASAAVKKTAWSVEPTRVNMVGTISKTGEFEKNGEQMVSLRPALAAVFETQVIPLVQYGLQIYGCEPSETSGETTDPWSVMTLELCKVWNQKVPNLETSQDLNTLAALTLQTAAGAMDTYIPKVEAELAETQDPEKKDLLQYYISTAKNILTQVKKWKLEPYQEGVSNFVSYEFDSEVFGMDMKGTIFFSFATVIAAPAIAVEAGILKESFENFFGEIQSILFALQNEDAETIDGAKSFLGEYLQIVKDMISDKN